MTEDQVMKIVRHEIKHAQCNGTFDLDKMRCDGCNATLVYAAQPGREPSRWELWREWWSNRP